MEYLTSPENISDCHYEYFKNEFLKLTGINLHLYKEKQMRRRINTLIARKHFSGYADFIEALKKDHGELENFVEYITINVTEFFRTPEHWSLFEEDVIIQLARKKKKRLKIWSCACSTGEEPYSIVMSLAEYLPLECISVTATDIDKEILVQAEKGIFSDKSLESIPDKFKQKYFSKSENGWKIADEVKKCIEFRRLDLLTDEYPSDQDLIVCRNVLIYFTEEAKNSVYTKFYEALSEDGYLFTGNTEQLIQYKKFGYTKMTNFIYQKQHYGDR